MTQYKHGQEIDQRKYLESLIRVNGGLMPCFIQQINYNKVELDILRKYANKFESPKILHAGCGMAFDSIYLSHFYKGMEAIELDRKVVELAKRNNSYLHGRLNIRQGDAFELHKKYDIIFFDGMAEYMHREDTVILLKKYLKLANYIFLSTTAYQARDRKITNVHTYTSLKEWKEIIKETGWEIKEIYGIQYPVRIMNIARYFPALAKLFCIFNARILYIVLKRRKKNEKEALKI